MRGEGKKELDENKADITGLGNYFFVKERVFGPLHDKITKRLVCLVGTFCEAVVQSFLLEAEIGAVHDQI